MANRQGTKKSQIALISARNSGKASMKITEMDKLALATLAADRELVEERANEMGDSHAFSEFVTKSLRLIADASDEEGREIEMVLCLARYGVALQTEVSC